MRVVVAIVAAMFVIAACGRDPLPGAAGPDPTPAGDQGPTKDRLFVATPAGVTIVNVAQAKVERDLPHGIMSPDQKTYWAVEPGPKTTVRKLEPVSGVELARFAVDGWYDLPKAYGPLPDAISANGRFLTLVAPEGDAFGFTVMDLRDGTEKGRAELQGTFTFDAIDDLGQSLYLHHYPQPDSGRYNVRLFDLVKSELLAQAITDVKVPLTAAALALGTMGGTYHASTTKGLWHFGLYTTTSRGPVVHALNMVTRYASCLLDLTSMSTHRAAWSIVPDPKHDRVYAINAATGHFATIGAQSLQVMHRTFQVEKGADGDLRGSAVVSADGSRIYATGGNGLLVIDGNTLSMKAQYLVGRELASVMVSPDGTRVYVLDRQGAISRIEPGSGRDLGVVARLPNAASIVSLD